MSHFPHIIYEHESVIILPKSNKVQSLASNISFAVISSAFCGEATSPSVILVLTRICESLIPNEIEDGTD